MTAQLQLLEDVGYDEPLHYHDPARSGFVSVLRQDGGVRKQTTFMLSELPFWMDRLRGETDVWLGQCEFFLPGRRKVGLKRIPLCFIDLDTYKLPALRGLSPEILTQRLLTACDDLGIPPPSMVVSSGRGLQVKWLFARPAESAALPRWSRVQQTLQTRLEDLGADPGALDCSRVLRLTGTINSRSGELVRVTHMTRVPTLGGEPLPSGVVGYAWDEFADTILPKTRGQIEEDRKAWQVEHEARLLAQATIAKIRPSKARSRSQSCLRALPVSQLAWDRLADLRTLVSIRWSNPAWGQGVPAGHRNTFMFLAACFLADCCTLWELEAELYALRSEFAPSWSHDELRSCVSTVMDKARASARGETIEFEGKQVSPKYKWTNQRLIELLSIDPSEERELKAIISKQTATTRDTERARVKRRLQGKPTRPEWLAVFEAKATQARTLAQEGQSCRTIAKVLGISKSAVARYCKKE
ncbi:hypothetical protein AAFF27_10995 [Xylophilus sp. GW821-FHT01B05]